MINDGQTRVIAHKYSRAPRDEFGRFFTSGRITESLLDYVDEYYESVGKSVEWPTTDPQGTLADMRALIDYLNAHGTRGQQLGWDRLWDMTVVPWSYGR